MHNFYYLFGLKPDYFVSFLQRHKWSRMCGTNHFYSTKFISISLGTTFMSCSNFKKDPGFSPKLMFNNIKSIMFNKFIIFILKRIFLMVFFLISNITPNCFYFIFSYSHGKIFILPFEF